MLTINGVYEHKYCDTSDINHSNDSNNNEIQQVHTSGSLFNVLPLEAVPVYYSAAWQVLCNILYPSHEFLELQGLQYQDSAGMT